MYRTNAITNIEKAINPLSVEAIEAEGKKQLNISSNVKNLPLVKRLRVYYNVSRLRTYLIEKRPGPYFINSNAEVAWHCLNQFWLAGWKIQVSMSDEIRHWTFESDINQTDKFNLRWAKTAGSVAVPKFYIKKPLT